MQFFFWTQQWNVTVYCFWPDQIQDFLRGAFKTAAKIKYIFRDRLIYLLIWLEKYICNYWNTLSTLHWLILLKMNISRMQIIRCINRTILLRIRQHLEQYFHGTKIGEKTSLKCVYGHQISVSLTSFLVATKKESLWNTTSFVRRFATRNVWECS